MGRVACDIVLGSREAIKRRRRFTQSKIPRTVRLFVRMDLFLILNITHWQLIFHLFLCEIFFANA